jgi:hypothetical protein
VKKAVSLLIPLIKELGIEDSVRLAEIKNNWHNIFNKPLSYHMSPSMLSKGEILLNVDSPVWLQELKFYKEDIIKKMSSYGVKAVRFRLGRVSTRTTSEVKSKKSRVKPLSTEELSYIDKTVSRVDDQDLRDTIRKAMGKAIATRKIQNSKF